MKLYHFYSKYLLYRVTRPGLSFPLFKLQLKRRRKGVKLGIVPDFNIDLDKKNSFSSILRFI